MIRRPGLLALVISCLLPGILVACAQVAPLVAVTGSGAIVGEVEMRRSGTLAWAKARPETVLYVGDTIRARQGAQVAFLDGTTIDLQGGSQVHIVAFGPDKKGLRFKLELATVETESSVARIQVSESTMEVAVESGAVNVLAEGKQQQLKSGQSLSVVAAQALAEQKPLSPTPSPQPATPQGTPSPSATPVKTSPAEAARTPSPPRGEMPPRLFRVFLARVSVGRTAVPSLQVTPTKQASGAATRTPQKTPSPKPTVPLSPTPSPTRLAIRVNCGGPAYRDKADHLWAADREYKPGGWGYIGGLVYSTANAIANTEDDLLYQSERWGDFYYLFDIPNGKYRVTLRFAEIYRDNVSGRIFSAHLEGHPVITDLDLVAKVGRDAAYDQVFTVDLRDGQLGVGFIKRAESPKISAIAIEAIP